uniref:7TM_GPCR_Srx domain-containing protein n=1 Tax=Rhabditophanes sp. KR3021 TaxID=114890 RepID=A0AC35U0T2_9BILA
MENITYSNSYINKLKQILIINDHIVFIIGLFLSMSYCLTKMQFAILIIINILWNNGFYFLTYIESNKPPNELIEASKHSLSPQFFIGIHGEPLQSILVFNPTSIISYFAIIHICLSGIIVFIGLSMLFIKIRTTLNESNHLMSKSTKQLQKQLTLVMVIHVITPLLLFGIPLTITACNIILNVNTNGHGYGHIMFIIMFVSFFKNFKCCLKTIISFQKNLTLN